MQFVELRSLPTEFINSMSLTPPSHQTLIYTTNTATTSFSTFDQPAYQPILCRRGGLWRSGWLSGRAGGGWVLTGGEGFKRHGGALVLESARLEPHNKREEIIIWNCGGRLSEGHLLIGQGATLVLDP